ncbi:MAG: PAS domain S-box protein, partial [Spirochaetales bacterium]|nr:PAS domain S-box protein [Spirochaetales bacterium]
LYEQNREARETGLKDYFQTTVTRDGKARTFRTLLFPLNLGDKKNLLAGIGIDMTDQILAREALKESEERLTSFIRTIPHGLMENDTAGVITLCNEGYCNLLGLEPEEVLGRNVTDFQPTEEEKRKRRKLIESLNQGKTVPGSFTGRILHSSGEIKDVQVDWNYHREEDGRITGYVAAVTDITPLLKAERRIHSSEALLKSIMESPRNINVWSVDKDIRYTFFNYNHKNAMKLYWGADIEIGTPLLDYILNEEYARAAQRYYDRVLGGEHITLVDKILNPEDGNIHMFENYANPISDDDGRITGATIFTIDITERLKNEDRIKQSLKEKEVLLKEIHHRVKNNLQIISSILNMQTEGIENDAVRKIFLDSQNRILSMSLIHEQLYQNEDVSGIQMEPYIQSLLATIVSSLTSPTETVTISSSVEPMELDIDTAIPVGLILNELVSNALKYACGKENDGELALSMETLGGNRCRIILKDSGPGISDTPDGARKNSLGLQLVDALTEQLGGTFSMKNDNGLVCTLEFPTPSQS